MGKRTSGVYKIQCLENNKKYIGSSYDIEHRFKKHKAELNHNRHYNTELQEDWNKFGEDSFVFEILEFTWNLQEVEQHYIDLIGKHFLYNIKPAFGDIKKVKRNFNIWLEAL